MTVEKIQYFQKHGRLPDEKPARKTASAGGLMEGKSLAELRLEDKLLTTNISKYRKKIDEQPNHKKVTKWSEDLAKMEASQRELRIKISDLTYATA